MLPHPLTLATLTTTNPYKRLKTINNFLTHNKENIIPMETPTLEKTIPENFEKIINDLTADLSSTFPEYSHLWNKWSKKTFDEFTPVRKEEEIRILYNYCISFYPKRFFDILYNNEDIFKENSPHTTLFLPNVDFKLLFNCENVSDKTRKIMWNYLQLVLMTVIGSVDSKDMFGSSAEQMFEGIEEKDLYKKLNETMESMETFFQSITKDVPATDTTPNTTPNTTEAGATEGSEDSLPTKENPEDEDDENDQDPFNPSAFFEKMKGIPDIKDIYGHLKTLFDGKIGSLAKELTDEISKDMENIFGEEGDTQPTSTKEIIEKLMKNPAKMTNLIKTVSNKLDSKISSGEISKDELLKEATELMEKMKDMGDSKDFQEMFKNISKMSGMGGMGGNKSKFDMNAFQQKTKHSSAREKLKEKMLKKRAMQIENAMANPPSTLINECIAHNASASSSTVKYTLTDTNKPNNYKFSIDGGLGENEFTPVEGGNMGLNMGLNTLIEEDEVSKPNQEKSSKKKGKKH